MRNELENPQRMQNSSLNGVGSLGAFVSSCLSLPQPVPKVLTLGLVLPNSFYFHLELYLFFRAGTLPWHHFL